MSFVRPDADAVVLTAFCARQAVDKVSGSGLKTDGNQLTDSHGAPLARWADDTRIVLNVSAYGRGIDTIRAFLGFWKRYKVIGVSEGILR